MSKHRVIGKMKGGQLILQCLNCKTEWAQFVSPVIPTKCPGCIFKLNEEDISIQERVAKIHARDATSFHLKISHIKETDWDQVPSKKVNKIYTILMDSE